MATQREAQLLLAARRAGMTSPAELANFMAQVSHESQGLTRLEEGFIYSRGIRQITEDASVKSALRQGAETLEVARLEAMQGRPQALAELMYGGRMDNDEPGDGYKYRGRGYIQLTGKGQYKEAGEALELDLVGNPALAADPENASRIAIWYWNKNVHANAPEDVTQATQLINNGLNGLKERQDRFAAWQSQLTPEVMEGLARGEVRLPMEAEAQAQTGRVLRSGSQGEQVQQLQEQLAGLGYTGRDGLPLQPDRQFGPSTFAAVQAFQRDHGLEPDGVVGSDTLKALRSQIESHQQDAPIPSESVLLRMDDSSHPAYSMYLQAREQVYRLDQEQGRAPDERSHNLAAALTVEASREGMQRIDQVVLSDDASRVWAVQRPLGVRDHFFDRHVSVDTAQAVNTSVEQSSATWSHAQPVNAPAQAQQQVQEQTPQQTGPEMLPRR